MKHLSIDGFAGGGGASCGLKMAGIDVTIAINHDPAAIRMHTVNHPKTLHLTEDIFQVDLSKYLEPDDVVDVMWASPDCTSHSKAKGGQPREAGLRILPWAVYRLCKQIKNITGHLPNMLMMENVEEIQYWGPLDKDGHPIVKKLGSEYHRFMNSMLLLGFDFQCRTLTAADYGAPTTRKRWYAVFRSDGKPIRWPEPTHSKDATLFGLKPWVPVSTCLDFSDLGSSIFERKKPLADATLKRIANGIKKFVVENPHPFFLDRDQALPFLIQYHSETTSGDVRGQTVDEPLKTIDTSNRYALVSVKIERKENERSNDYFEKANRNGCNCITSGRNFLEESQDDEYQKNDFNSAQKDGSKTEKRVSGNCVLESGKTISGVSTQSSLDIANRGNSGTHGHKPQGREQTQQQSGESGNCKQGREFETCLSNGIEENDKLCKGFFGKGKDIEVRWAHLSTNSERTGNISDNSLQSKQVLIAVWIMKYYGSGANGQSVDDPLATITTKDRFGMVSTILMRNHERYAIADIYMRMLKPEELKLAQGFPKDYIIDHDADGNPYPIKEQVAKIGNSVVPIMAAAIAKANLEE